MDGNPYMALQPSAPPAASGAISMARLEAVLQRFEITIAQANDLVVLSDYQIVVIADDSSSMLNNALPMHMRVRGQPTRRRWDELRETLAEVVEIASCFDQNGIDIHFLNRAPITHVKSGQDANFKQAFAQPPQGRTPLTETLQRVSKSTQGEKPVLLFIFTDGEPSDGSESFTRAIRQVVSGGRVRIQIMACTANDEEIGWLDVLDRELAELDVTDDYYAEKEQVLKLGLAPKFTRGDWCMKAMLGPVSRKFDLWDEQAAKKSHKASTEELLAQCALQCLFGLIFGGT
mmetsp:Transcript_102512/g.271292  ORF Transcript_102512/g.271292 Transcript_102512/m.271292 type:complete len:289 (-) Transcript_102512:147-1013(-)